MAIGCGAGKFAFESRQLLNAEPIVELSFHSDCCWPFNGQWRRLLVRLKELTWWRDDLAFPFV